ncbi:hypothetical protein HOU04_gp051 [Synechococcus phage S-T4]|uniref:DUF1825 domain-containing protein n=1 Tax=Synechococcus phage S-T4 TaxID=2268578 RepID=A0A385EFL8_9CAUD|nr:hypothetical protein HOU04_gp051 [Synechococcus phage S-T4]AXQ70450.1 hypothetical protein [Synechococcus phage S-T4]
MDSDIIQKELDDINNLQEEIYNDIWHYDDLDYDGKLEHLDRVYELVEKQSIMYTRMSLSDDPFAIERKEAIQEFVEMMGFGRGSDVNAVFMDMKETLKEMMDDLDS